MWIKICANTSLADAQLTAELGADAVGFVFAPSKRLVTAAQVAEITPHLPDSVEKIGVFHSGDGASIAETARVAGLTGIQLHAAFDLPLVAELNAAFEGRMKIIQAVPYHLDAADRVGSDVRFAEALGRVLAEPGVSAVLLDAAIAGVSGGLGAAFDWEHVAPLVRATYGDAALLRAVEELPQLIVAGGLNAENVGGAIAAFTPGGVDVASGVEARPGVKDPERLRAFLKAAHGAKA